MGAEFAVGVLFCDAVARKPGLELAVVGVNLPPCDPEFDMGEADGNGGAGERAREDDAETPDLREFELGVERKVGRLYPNPFPFPFPPVVPVAPFPDPDPKPGPVLIELPALVRGVIPPPPLLPLWEVPAGMELGSTLALIRVGGLDGDEFEFEGKPYEGVEVGEADEDEEEIVICPVT